MRVRLIVPVLLVLAATAAGFALARINANRDARRDAQHRADIAATEVSRCAGGSVTDASDALPRFSAAFQVRSELAS